MKKSLALLLVVALVFILATPFSVSASGTVNVYTKLHVYESYEGLSGDVSQNTTVYILTNPSYASATAAYNGAGQSEALNLTGGGASAAAYLAMRLGPKSGDITNLIADQPDYLGFYLKSPKADQYGNVTIGLSFNTRDAELFSFPQNTVIEYSEDFTDSSKVIHQTTILDIYGNFNVPAETAYYYRIPLKNVFTSTQFNALAAIWGLLITTANFTPQMGTLVIDDIHTASTFNLCQRLILFEDYENVTDVASAIVLVGGPGLSASIIEPGGANNSKGLQLSAVNNTENNYAWALKSQILNYTQGNPDYFCFYMETPNGHAWASNKVGISMSFASDSGWVEFAAGNVLEYSENFNDVTKPIYTTTFENQWQVLVPPNSKYYYRINIKNANYVQGSYAWLSKVWYFCLKANNFKQDAGSYVVDDLCTQIIQKSEVPGPQRIITPLEGYENVTDVASAIVLVGGPDLSASIIESGGANNSKGLQLSAVNNTENNYAWALKSQILNYTQGNPDYFCFYMETPNGHALTSNKVGIAISFASDSGWVEFAAGNVLEYSENFNDVTKPIYTTTFENQWQVLVPPNSKYYYRINIKNANYVQGSYALLSKVWYFCLKANAFKQDAGSFVVDDLCTAIPKVIDLSNCNVSKDDIITNIAVNTSIAGFISSLSPIDGVNLAINQHNSQSLYVGTGLTVAVTFNGQTRNYQTVIYGDVTGDGEISITDLVEMRNHLLKTNTLSGPYKLAGDISSKGSITISDLISVKKHLLEIQIISQTTA